MSIRKYRDVAFQIYVLLHVYNGAIVLDTQTNPHVIISAETLTFTNLVD